MKTLRIATFTTLLLAGLSLFAQSNGQRSFDAMKQLDGTWVGKTAQGEPVEVSYRMTANGSSLMSEIHEQHGDMITMIHMDGGRLLLTHYCSAGNQPRMQASASPDGKTITFDFVDSTNLASPDAGHMHRVVFIFVDANHHTEEWQFQDHGKQMVERFELQKKS